MRYFIIYLFILLVTCPNIRAQDTIEFTPPTIISDKPEYILDKVDPELRIPPKEKIEKYKNNKHFNYQESKPFKYPDWLLNFLDWLDRLFGRTASKVLTRELFTSLFVILLVAVIVTIILRTQNVSWRILFGKKKVDTDEAEFYSEDVNNMDFESLIAESIKNKNYRLAIRFLYLKNLKSLSDREIIVWNPNKTNYSYQYEIKNDRIRSEFIDTTRIFDFVWYGEFILDEQSFGSAHNMFNEFNRTIQNER